MATPADVNTEEGSKRARETDSRNVWFRSAVFLWEHVRPRRVFFGWSLVRCLVPRFILKKRSRTVAIRTRALFIGAGTKSRPEVSLGLWDCQRYSLEAYFLLRREKIVFSLLDNGYFIFFSLKIGDNDRAVAKK